MKSCPAKLKCSQKTDQQKKRENRQKRDIPEDVHDEGEDGEHLEEEEDLGGDREHIVLVEVVQQVLIMIMVLKKEKVVLKIMIMTMMATVIMIHYAR